MYEDLDPKARYRKLNRDEINRKQREYWHAKKNGTLELKNKPDPVTPKQREAIDEMILANIGTNRSVIAQVSKQYFKGC